MEHHEPTSNVPTDASERRITTPIPVAPAVLMAVVLAAITALLLCVWRFADISDGDMIHAVILGIGLPLLTIGALFYYSALARRLHVYSEGKHADRQSEHAEILAEVRALQAELSRIAPAPVDDELRRQVAELSGAVGTIQRQISAAMAGSFDPATKANIRSLNRELSQQ